MKKSKFLISLAALVVLAATGFATANSAPSQATKDCCHPGSACCGVSEACCAK